MPDASCVILRNAELCSYRNVSRSHAEYKAVVDADRYLGPSAPFRGVHRSPRPLLAGLLPTRRSSTASRSTRRPTPTPDSSATSPPATSRPPAATATSIIRATWVNTAHARRLRRAWPNIRWRAGLLLRLPHGERQGQRDRRARWLGRGAGHRLPRRAVRELPRSGEHPRRRRPTPAPGQATRRSRTSRCWVTPSRDGAELRATATAASTTPFVEEWASRLTPARWRKSRASSSADNANCASCHEGKAALAAWGVTANYAEQGETGSDALPGHDLRGLPRPARERAKEPTARRSRGSSASRSTCRTPTRICA